MTKRACRVLAGLLATLTLMVLGTTSTSALIAAMPTAVEYALMA